jgi:hypothetical protein
MVSSGYLSVIGEITDEEVAQLFHEVYERLAPQFGYTTRRDSAVPWDEVPGKNKALMIAAAGYVMDEVRRRLEGDDVASPAQEG